MNLKQKIIVGILAALLTFGSAPAINAAEVMISDDERLRRTEQLKEFADYICSRWGIDYKTCEPTGNDILKNGYKGEIRFKLVDDSDYGPFLLIEYVSLETEYSENRWKDVKTNIDHVCFKTKDKSNFYRVVEAALSEARYKPVLALPPEDRKNYTVIIEDLAKQLAYIHGFEGKENPCWKKEGQRCLKPEAEICKIDRILDDFADRLEQYIKESAQAE